jgi:hypothetical protein
LDRDEPTGRSTHPDPDGLFFNDFFGEAIKYIPFSMTVSGAIFLMIFD